MGVSNPEADTGPPALAPPLERSFCPTTRSAEGCVGLLSTEAAYRSTRLFPVSAIHRLPAESNATPRGWFSPFLVAEAFFVEKSGCP